MDAPDKPDTPARRPLRSILEPVTPLSGFDASAMARGEPGVPQRFSWRGKTYVVAEVLDTKRESDDVGGERYVRRHVFRVRTESGEVMNLSGARGARDKASRWILRSIEGDPAGR